MLLLHKSKYTYRHRQRYEYIIEQAEDSAADIGKLEEKSSAKVWQNLLRKYHLVNFVSVVTIQAIEEVHQNLPGIDVFSFVENIVEESVEIEEACRVVSCPILSLELGIVILLLFDVDFDLLHV